MIRQPRAGDDCTPCSFCLAKTSRASPVQQPRGSSNVVGKGEARCFANRSLLRGAEKANPSQGVPVPLISPRDGADFLTTVSDIVDDALHATVQR